MSQEWLQFWESGHNAFGPDAECEVEAIHVSGGVIREANLAAGSTVLDWGCGWALGVPVYLSNEINVILHDRSARFLQACSERYGRNETVTTVNQEQLRQVADHSIDAVLAFSVSQYLDDDELREFFSTCARLLAPSGLLLLGDVIPNDVTVFSDVASLLRHQKGPTEGRDGKQTFFKRLGTISQLLFSNYTRLRLKNGLRRWSEKDINRILSGEGMVAKKLPANLGWNQSRVTFSAKLKAAAVVATVPVQCER